MSQQEIITKCKEYREYKRMAEELLNLAESIGDDLKAYMQETGESKLIVGEYKLSYTEVKRSDIDKKQLQADHAELYASYLKETSYKRFLVS